MGLSDFVSAECSPKLLAVGQAPDPVRVVSTIREQHCLWEQRAEQNRTQPIVVRFTGREGEMDWQAVGVHDRVNLAREAPSRATHILVIVVRDTGSVLVHAHAEVSIICTAASDRRIVLP